MKNNGKEINQEEMEKATGGETFAFSGERTVISHIMQFAHCRVCHQGMASYNAKYRCQTPNCSECGKDKTVTEVDWY